MLCIQRRPALLAFTLFILIGLASGREAAAQFTGSVGTTSAALNARTRAIAFSPDGTLLAESQPVTVGDQRTGRVRLWDVRTRKVVNIFSGAPRPLQALAFSPDSTRLAGGGTADIPQKINGWLGVWDVKSGKIEWESSQPNIGFTRGGLAYGATGRVLLSVHGVLTPGPRGTGIQQWDAATGAPLTRLEIKSAKAGLFNTVCFSPHRLLVALGISDVIVTHSPLLVRGGESGVAPSGDGMVLLSDVTLGAVRRSIEDLAAQPSALAFSPDNRLLAVATEAPPPNPRQRNAPPPSGELRLLKVDGGATQWRRDVGSIRSVAFSPSGDLLATVGEDRAIRLWEVVTGQPRGLVAIHCHGASAISFSPDSRYIVSCGDLEGVRWWAVPATPTQGTDGHSPRVLAGGAGSVSSIAYEQDGRTIAVGATRGELVSLNQPLDNPQQSIELRDAVTGNIRQVVKSPGLRADQIAFIPGERILAALTDGGRAIAMWDSSTGRLLKTLTPRDPALTAAPARFLSVSPNGRLLATAAVTGSGDRSGVIALWDLRQAQIIRQCPVAGTPTGILFTPDCKRLLITAYPRMAGSPTAPPGEVEVSQWDLTGTRLQPLLPRESGYLLATAFSPDGRVLAGSRVSRAQREPPIQLWDARNGALQRSLQIPSEDDGMAHVSVITALSFSRDGSMLAALASDGRAWLWQAASGRLLRTFMSGCPCPGAMSFSPDGKTLALNGGDGSVHLWPLDDRW